MGNTIRRKPVTVSIPSSPDYKYLNITNFGGLEVSDNPFVVSNNSAKEILNVYVDETNTLTTRLRLKKRLQLRSDRHIANVLEWDNNICAIIELNGKYHVSVYLNGSSIETIPAGIALDTTHIPTMTQDANYIYFICGSDGLYSLDKQTIYLSRITPYAPLVSVGMTKFTDGKDFESRNIMSPWYRKSIYWDDSWNLNSLENFSRVSAYKNKSNINHEDLWISSRVRSTDSNYPIKFMYTTAIKEQIQGDVTNKIGYVSYSKDLSSVQYSEPVKAYNAGVLDEVYAVSNFNGDVIYSTVFNKAIYKNTTTNNQTAHQQIDTNFSYRRTIHGDPRLFTDVSGDVIVYEKNQNDVYTLYCKNLATSKTYTLTTTISGSQDLDCVFSNNLVVIKMAQSNISGQIIIINKSTMTSIGSYGVRGTQSSVSCYGNTVYVHNYGSDITKYEVKSDNTIETIQLPLDITKISNSGDICAYGDNLYTRIGYYHLPTNEFISTKNYGTGFFNDGVGKIETIDGKLFKTSRNNYTYNSQAYDIALKIVENDEPIDVNFYDNEFEFPEFDSRIVKKFDNNYWLFDKHKIYKTINSDLTYIPANLVTEVGNGNPFTGANVISDTVMVVYTKDKLYAITDASTSENDYAYTVTETKQTVGNTPLNAPIISAYNELVLQFNKDGVYALRTLENVQSTERIAEMISDKITPLWEKESDYIDNLITVKRLYWTYVIIPHETDTHIYLYDGRTNDWFYWELPILVKFVYEKDNKVYMMDNKNQMYSLEKEEATTMLTENTQFTEYYDEVDDEHKLIKWFWKSQILPLGTINYAKRIVSTTFILTDTDSLDKYGLNYKFTAYKKNVTSTPDSTIVNNIVYVQSVTKKTVLPRVNFIQITLSNIPEEDENAYDTNKLRLTGLGIKYVLLSGGMN